MPNQSLTYVGDIQPENDRPARGALRIELQRGFRRTTIELDRGDSTQIEIFDPWWVGAGGTPRITELPVEPDVRVALVGSPGVGSERRGPLMA